MLTDRHRVLMFAAVCLPIVSLLFVKQEDWLHASVPRFVNNASVVLRLWKAPTERQNPQCFTYEKQKVPVSKLSGQKDDGRSIEIELPKRKDQVGCRSISFTLAYKTVLVLSFIALTVGIFPILRGRP